MAAWDSDGGTVGLMDDLRKEVDVSHKSFKAESGVTHMAPESPQVVEARAKYEYLLKELPIYLKHGIKTWDYCQLHDDMWWDKYRCRRMILVLRRYLRRS